MRYKNKESGIYFILSALIVTALVGIIALAVDIGTLYRDKLQLQKIADSAVAVGLAWDAINRAQGLDKDEGAVVIDAVIALNKENLDLTTGFWDSKKRPPNLTTDFNRNHLPVHFYNTPNQSSNFPVKYIDGSFVMDKDNNQVITPPQGIALTLQTKPKLYFSFLKNIPGISNKVYATGRLRPANIALVLDFSGSMCCDLNPANPNCNIPACSPIAGSDVPTITPTSKAAHLIVAVEHFLSNFHNFHDHVSFTLFNTVAETRYSMKRTTIGRTSERNTETNKRDKAAKWFPPDRINKVSDFPLVFDPSKELGTWGHIISGTGDYDPIKNQVTKNTIFAGNTNPSDALLRAFLDTRSEKRVDQGILGQMEDGVTNIPALNPGPVHYVFFTDGAPTAARFLIPSVRSGERRTALPNTYNVTRNEYNPYEIMYRGRFNNIGDYYNFKNMYIWEKDAAGNPTKFQYAPSPLIRTAIDSDPSTGDTTDDGDIHLKLSKNSIKNSINFSNIDMAQYGSKYEGKFVDGVWSDYAWDDSLFDFIPPCAYGGINRELLKNSNEEYHSPKESLPDGLGISPAPTQDPNSNAHQESNYRRWFETANLGLCCDRSGFRMENKGDDYFKNIDGDLTDDDGNPIDICGYTSANAGTKLCVEALNPNYLPLTAYQNDPVWDKSRRCFYPVGGCNSTFFAIPYFDQSGSQQDFKLELSLRPDCSTNNWAQSSDNWAKLYYDTAIAYADMIRNNNGIIYAIGLGADPAYNNDFYQNVHDDYRRHDYFLTRLTLDKDYCEFNEGFNQNFEDGTELGCGLDTNCSMTSKIRNNCSQYFQRDAESTYLMTWQNWGLTLNNNIPAVEYGSDYVHRYQYGKYYPINNVEDLDPMFQQIAREILISLAK